MFKELWSGHDFVTNVGGEEGGQPDTQGKTMCFLALISTACSKTLYIPVLGQGHLVINMTVLVAFLQQ